MTEGFILKVQLLKVWVIFSIGIDQPNNKNYEHVSKRNQRYPVYKAELNNIMFSD